MKLPLPMLLAAETAISTALRMDPETRQRLSLLNGKTVRINLTAPEVSLLLSVVDSRIQLDQPDDDGVLPEIADVQISGHPVALRSLLDGNNAVYEGKVDIRGDVATSAHIKQIIAALDPDWQEAISPILGDGLTHRLDVLQTDLRRWFGRTRSASRDNTRDYLQEEAQVLAPDSEIRRFCAEVDDVRAGSDRLAARVQRLEAAMQMSKT